MSAKQAPENPEKKPPRQAKHRLVYQHILHAIETGSYKEGDRLPSESALVKEFSTSRPTVARALHDLQLLGLIERKVGSGSYVRNTQKIPEGWRFGLLIPGLGNTEIFDPICGQLARIAQQLQHTLLWGDLGDKNLDPSPSLMEQACRSYIRQKVAGVFFAPIELADDNDRINQSVTSTLDKAGIPIVLLDRDLVAFPDRSRYDLVGIDNRRAGYLVTDHLLKLGCRRIDFLARPNSAPTVKLRISGYREAMLSAELDAEPSWVHQGNPADQDFVGGMIKSGASAIICANDITAANLMKTLDALGCRMPQQVRIAGFDDVKYAELLRPGLTTIHQPCLDMGTIAMQAMLERIAHPDFPARDILAQPLLIVRQSCGAALAPSTRRVRARSDALVL